uniref:Uncharacterized protein n=1 Tax=Riboviria sp. TaxID=2585031 RepID=A0A8K1U2A3_9VIRU|nr:MAG: hypothetical protein 2 [Riboviria sp.]
MRHANRESWIGHQSHVGEPHALQPDVASQRLPVTTAVPTHCGVKRLVDWDSTTQNTPTDTNCPKVTRVLLGVARLEGDQITPKRFARIPDHDDTIANTDWVALAELNLLEHTHGILLLHGETVPQEPLLQAVQLVQIMPVQKQHTIITIVDQLRIHTSLSQVLPHHAAHDHDIAE